MTFLEVTPIKILQLISYVLFSDLAQKFYHDIFIQYYLFVERFCRGRKIKVFHMCSSITLQVIFNTLSP